MESTSKREGAQEATEVPQRSTHSQEGEYVDKDMRKEKKKSDG